MKKIVEYDSKMNEFSFGKFKEKELDLFFSICYKMKFENLNEVTLTFQELKELSKYTDRNLDRFVTDLKAVYKKLLNITMELESEKYIEGFTLFTSYRVKKEEREVSIKINQDYRFILNEIGKFTKFDLVEFVSLKSSYAKNIFKLLKQFDKDNKENWYQIEIEQFKELLGVPKSYKMSHIDSFILNPAIEQLRPYFKGLRLEKIKKGIRISGLKFTWKNEKEKKGDIIEVQPVKRKKATLGEKELQEHEREQLENTIQELEKKKKVKNIPSNPIVELKKITKKDYENLYKDYLERLGEKHNLYMRKSFDFINKTKYEIIEDVEKKTIFTENNIDESLLVSKTGKKLVGMARKNKIEKILEEMNQQY